MRFSRLQLRGGRGFGFWFAGFHPGPKLPKIGTANAIVWAYEGVVLLAQFNETSSTTRSETAGGGVTVHAPLHEYPGIIVRSTK
jgi:hypothetical protein